MTTPRFKRQQEIEDAIEKFNPDPNECVELIHALQASLRFQFEDKAGDAQDALSAACQALDELDNTITAEYCDTNLDEQIERLRAMVNK